jgi:hypothetical protein
MIESHRSHCRRVYFRRSHGCCRCQHGAMIRLVMQSIRLTSAVEHIATQLEVLHKDIKEDRRETFGRLSTVEQRVSKLEARPPSC